MIYFLIAIYGLLLCYVRFTGISHVSYMPFFSLYEDPTYYSNDIYIQNSLIGGSSYLYPLLKIFGSLPSNTYFIFLLYIIVNLINVFITFKIAETLFPTLRKYDVGLVALLVFLYDYPIFTAYSQIVSYFSFSPTMVAMPILSASLYYFLRNRILLAIFMVGVGVIPLHFKSAWFILLVMVGYLLFIYKEFGFKKILWAFAWAGVGLVMMLFYRQHHVSHAPLNHAQLIEMCEAVRQRDLDEVVVLWNPWYQFLKFFLIFGFGAYCIRYIRDEEHRRKLTFLFAVSLMVLVAGALYTSFLYQWFPSPEILLLSFPRAMGYPIIISFILIAGIVLEKMVYASANKKIQWLGIILLFALAYFPNFKSTIFLYIGLMIAFYFLTYRQEFWAKQMHLKPFTAWFYVVVVVFLFIKAGEHFQESIKERSPFIPLIVYNLNRDFYDCQIWAKSHTAKDSIFAAFMSEKDSLYTYDGFRRFSGRSMIFGDYNHFYLDYNLIQEHNRRNLFIERLMALIQAKNQAGIEKLIAQVPWRLDYIVLPKSFFLPYPPEYTNEGYVCYRIAHPAKVQSQSAHL